MALGWNCLMASPKRVWISRRQPACESFGAFLTTSKWRQRTLPASRDRMANPVPRSDGSTASKISSEAMGPRIGETPYRVEGLPSEGLDSINGDPFLPYETQDHLPGRFCRRKNPPRRQPQRNRHPRLSRRHRAWHANRRDLRAGGPLHDASVQSRRGLCRR